MKRLRTAFHLKMGKAQLDELFGKNSEAYSLVVMKGYLSYCHVSRFLHVARVGEVSYMGQDSYRTHLEVVCGRIYDGEVITLVALRVRVRARTGKPETIWESPSIELAFTSCAQSTSNGSGMASQEDIDSGRRRYTCAEESLSTWNQTSCGHAYLIKSSSRICQ